VDPTGASQKAGNFAFRSQHPDRWFQDRSRQGRGAVLRRPVRRPRSRRAHRPGAPGIGEDDSDVLGSLGRHVGPARARPG